MMSASPALRTLLAIIFAASARSYRSPESSPVASGWAFSSSMMYRSMVTTEVAVCFTLSFLGDTGASRLGESTRREFTGVNLVRIVMIAVTQALPNVMERKAFARVELLYVTELVQQELRGGPSAGSQEDRSPERDRGDRLLAEEPAGDSRRNSDATELCRSQLGVAGTQVRR